MKNQNKFYTEEQKEVFKFGKILLGLIAIVGLMYFFTVYVVNKDDTYKRTNNEGSVQYEKIILGTMLNRLEDEYYVLIYDASNMDNSIIYNRVSQYKSSNKNIPLYIADLHNELNKDFIADNSHYNADSIDDFKVKGTTLVLVKNHKIKSFIENYDEIVNILK